MVNLTKVNLLRNAEIEEGSRWLYVADFNIKESDLKDDEKCQRVTSELKDIEYISKRKGIVLILAHKGNYPEAKDKSLKFVVPYLKEKLGKVIHFSPYNTGAHAQEFVNQLRSGSIALLENSRINKDEESENADLGTLLAEEYAKLCDHVAIGGFGKAHRKNASNYWIIGEKDCYLTESQVKEMNNLEPWSGKSNEFSIAVLGGVKKEKLNIGLDGFSKIYNIIIPGGVVLNSLIKYKLEHILRCPPENCSLGNSVILEHTYSLMREIFLDRERRRKIYIPNELIIYDGQKTENITIEEIAAQRGVLEGKMIVDFKINDNMLKDLKERITPNSRALLAGLPSLYEKGFTNATDQVTEILEGCNTMVLGGDTNSAISFRVNKSAGGGSALYFLVKGTTPVFEKLKDKLF